MLETKVWSKNCTRCCVLSIFYFFEILNPTVDTRDGGAFVITAEQEEILGVKNFVTLQILNDENNEISHGRFGSTK